MQFYGEERACKIETNSPQETQIKEEAIEICEPSTSAGVFRIKQEEFSDDIQNFESTGDKYRYIKTSPVHYGMNEIKVEYNEQISERELTVLAAAKRYDQTETSKSKRQKIGCTKDPNVWTGWLEELSDNDDDKETDDGSDSGEEDHVSVSEHMTDSEEAEEADEYGGGSVHRSGTTSFENWYTGRDGTKWERICTSREVQGRACNSTEFQLSGPKGDAIETKTEISIWNQFFDDKIINLLVVCSNVCIYKSRNKFQKDADVNYTDETEIRALLGLLYYIGSLRSSRKSIHGFWDNSKGSALECCYLTMSEDRFRLLIKCLRFDNIMLRPMKVEIDKLAPIRNIVEKLVRNFQKYFSPSECLTVDEQFLLFTGQCSFRQYMPTKPAEYGIKVFALVDSKTSYTCNLEIYASNQPKGPYRVSNLAEDVVLRLAEPYSGSRRNITGDNWFTSVSLAKKLQKKKLTYVGTIRKDKRQIPKEFLPNKNRREYSSLIGFNEDCTLVSYCPKQSKAVLVLSTMPCICTTDESAVNNNKPGIVSFYDMTKIGVDLLDQLCRKYDVTRNTRRWPMLLFYNLLNISAINAVCIYKYHHTNRKTSRLEFLQNLSWSLIKPQMESRLQKLNIPAEVRRRAKLLLNLKDVEDLVEARTGYAGAKDRDKPAKEFCSYCGKWMCSIHLKLCSEVTI